jgi:hypothetical protein
MPAQTAGDGLHDASGSDPDKQRERSREDVKRQPRVTQQTITRGLLRR